MDIQFLLARGCHIEIAPFAPQTVGFHPANFRMSPDGMITCNNIPRPDLTIDKLSSHVLQMIDEGFQIAIHS